MRCITKYRFKQMGGIIPNINRLPSISIDVEEHSSSKIITYSWTNPETNLKFGLLRLQISEHYLDFLDSSVQIAKECGLFYKTPYSWLAIVDSLYYACNPVKFKQDITSTTLNKLAIRLSNHSVSHLSNVTKSMINAVTDKLYASIPKPTQDSTLEEIFEYTQQASRINNTLIGYIHFDIINLEWVDSSSCDKISTRLGKIAVSQTSLTYSKFNLVKYTPSSNSSSYTYRVHNFYINPETETVYDYRIYLKTELDLRHCHICNAEHIADNISEDGCPSCLKDLTKVHSYSTKVPDLLKFKATKVKPNTLYLGAELEYESRSNRDKDAIFSNRSLRGHAILKSDGSIRNGFEIVTCPATLDIHLAEFKKFFSGLKTNSNLHGDSNTGMHVHISRKPLSMLTVGKMTAFLNNEDNSKFLEKIAGRKLNSYCQQSKDRTVSYPLVNGIGGARYNILNLSNSDTVELRMFSTPESYEDFAHKLEFTEALANYCSPCTVNHSVYGLLKFTNFISWVNTMKHSYPHLVSKLKTL